MRERSMKDIPLWENEKIFLKTRIHVPDINLKSIHGNVGEMIITNFRIASKFHASGLFYEMPHELITSFKWDSGFRKGNNFKITWFVNQQSIQAHYHSKDKKKIVKLLEKMSYYNKPAVLKPWIPATQDEASVEIPINILKIRYASGEITKEEFEEMKTTLQ